MKEEFRGSKEAWEQLGHMHTIMMIQRLHRICSLSTNFAKNKKDRAENGIACVVA